MKRTYKKKSSLINKTGYTPGYDTEKNPINYIPSEDITMANTPYPIYATPLDENGNPIGKGMVMQPGGEYKFPGASYVAEMPMFAKGGKKSDWISNKISILVREGYPQKQAIAIAYSMYENKHVNGGYQLPMYQSAGTYNFGNAFPGSNFAKPKFSEDPNLVSPEKFSEQMKKTAEIKPTDYGLGVDPNKPNPLSEESLTAGKDFAKRADDYAKSKGLNFSQDLNKNIFGEAEDMKESEIAPPNIQSQEPFQFFNPYSGFDIPTAASTLGSSIESGDTLGTVASGLKLATGLARNFFGGMGQERRKNYLMKQQAEKQREGMTGAGREQALKFGGYYQEGGMQPGMEQTQGGDIQQQVAEAIQQGASPEEVMQQLIQMGMPEDQAMALVQGIMEQMQPSTPQLKRGGMMYYQDGGEDEYGEEEPNYMINKPSLMGRQQNFSQPTNIAMESNMESIVEPETEKEEAPKYDKNSARDTWVAKTGLPWSEAKRLGYTDGSAKDNMKLLSELNDPRFKKEYLRKSPAPGEKTYYGGQLKEVVVTRPKKNNYVDPYKGWYNDKEGDLRNEKGVMVGLDGKPLNFFERNFTSPITLPPLDESGRRMPRLKPNATIEEANAYRLAQYKNKMKQDAYNREVNKRRQQELDKIWGKIPSNTPFIQYQDGGEQQVAQQVAQAMQQGMQPQEAMSMLMESGMTEDQALQMVQAIMEQLQQQTETPQLRKGGEMIRRADGSYSRRGLWDNIRENRGSGEKPTKEMLEQEAKIKANQKEMGGYMYSEGGINNPGFKALPKYVQDKIKSNMYQDGGMESGEDPTEMIMQQVSQMLEQGADPQQIVQMLVEAGVPEEQAMQMVEAVMQQSEQMPEMRDGGIPERYKKMGFSKVGAKKKSTRPGKKWMVLAKKGDQYKIVHGGDSNMKDFSQHGSEKRKDRFWNRMGGRDSAKANDPFSPLYWHKKFGTWQEGGEMEDEENEGENEGTENESAMSEQIESQVEQALKQGADPEQVLQQLIQMGMPEKEAIEMIQEILQEMQGGEENEEEGGEEEEEGTPQMSKGGKYMRALVGKTIKSYTYNPKTDSYIVSYE